MPLIALVGRVYCPWLLGKKRPLRPLSSFSYPCAVRTKLFVNVNKTYETISGGVEARGPDPKVNIFAIHPKMKTIRVSLLFNDYSRKQSGAFPTQVKDETDFRLGWFFFFPFSELYLYMQ